MSLFNLRDLVPFPAGDNASDTIIAGIHLNRTVLDHWNYTLYSNNTLSNESSCYLIFGSYRPSLLSNGTFINGTSCYMPIGRIKTRGQLGIAFAALFALSIVFTLLNLKKHGATFIREEKRFRIVGRRWQWYWMLFVATCGIISTITGIDVDRDYLQELPIILQSFFFVLMVPAVLAAVWEAMRHWGSWQERQIVDADEHAFLQDDRRAKFEFMLPLVFYLFAWMNFFITIPRPWDKLQMQRSPEQQASIAAPAGTDLRFKIGAILAAVALVIICISLQHSIKHYKSGGRGGLWGAATAFCVHCPTKLFLALVVLGVRIAYGVVMAWKWELSIFKYDGDPAWPYALGYAPVLLIIVIFNVAGFAEENEDLSLLRQRRTRGRAADRELDYTKKPLWWQWGKTEFHMSPEQRLRALADEVDVGRRPGGRTGVDEMSAVELANMGTGGLRNRSRSRSRVREDPFRDGIDSPVESVRRESDNSVMTGGTRWTGRTLTESGQAPRGRRSMLDA